MTQAAEHITVLLHEAVKVWPSSRTVSMSTALLAVVVILV